MIETQKSRIDGIEFQLRHFPPKQSIKILVRLLRMIAAPAVRGLEGGKSLLDGNLSFEKVVDGFMANVTDDSVIELCELIITYVEIKSADGFREVNFESDFQGRIDLLFSVVKESVIFNYGDLVKKNMGVVEGLKNRSKSPSSKTT